MADETLVEALERAGVGTYSAEYRGMVARDADPIFKTLARFASPEAKREVLRQLAGERTQQMTRTEIQDFAEAVEAWHFSVENHLDPASDVTGYRREAVCLLAPLEAP